MTTNPLTAVAIAVALLCGVADGGVATCVVKIGGGCGVVVTGDGLVMSVKHVTEGRRQLDVIHATKGCLTGTLIYETTAVDGVAVVQLPDGEYDYYAVSERLPIAGDRVTIVHASGIARDAKMLGSVYVTNDHYGGQSVLANETTFCAEPGWSGGPLLDSDGCVIGLTLAGNHKYSSFTPFAEVRDVAKRCIRPRVVPVPPGVQAEQLPAIPGVIYVHLLPPNEPPFTCPPCERFKRDHAAGHFAGYSIVFVEGGASLYPMFKWEGGSLSGYNGVEWLKERLPRPQQAEKPIVPPPSNPPAVTIPEPSQPIADSAPVAPPIEQPTQEQPPPAPAARTEPSTRLERVVGVLGTGLSIYQIGIAVATGGIGAGAIPLGRWIAGRLAGRAVRRRRSQDEPAAAGETRAPPGPFPWLKIVSYPNNRFFYELREAVIKYIDTHPSYAEATEHFWGFLTNHLEVTGAVKDATKHRL